MALNQVSIEIDDHSVCGLQRRITQPISTPLELEQMRLGRDGFHFALRRAAKTTGMELEGRKDG